MTCINKYLILPHLLTALVACKMIFTTNIPVFVHETCHFYDLVTWRIRLLPRVYIYREYNVTYVPAKKSWSRQFWTLKDPTTSRVKMKFRAAWQFSFLIVFVGYMFIWVMLPTKTYKFSWLPNLKEKLNSTYFREQGKTFCAYWLLFFCSFFSLLVLQCICRGESCFI